MDIVTAIKGYNDARVRMQRAFTSPVELSNLAVKIALYGTYIGDTLGELESTYELEKSKSYMEALQSKKSATQAENESRAINASTKAEATRLKTVHRDLYALVSVIQSRLKTLENEQRNNI